jgi:AraC family transcriptional regulator
MSKQILRGLSQQNQPDTSEVHPDDLPVADRRAAGEEMARVLKTAPLRIASDPSSGSIAHWKHGALHDVVEPMADHVVMTYPRACSGWSGATENRLRLERRVPAW